MPTNRLYYWDTNLFLYYLNNDPERVPTLEAILDGISQGNKEKIVTSVITKVEISWIASEKYNRALSAEEEENIDAFLSDASIIELVDFNEEITYIARSLRRRAMERGWSLKTIDAIHLATAEWVGAVEMNTYDDRLFKYNELIGIDVKAPVATQPKLF
jgi:predicted nucleic acid-binding protein